VSEGKGAWAGAGGWGGDISGSWERVTVAWIEAREGKGGRGGGGGGGGGGLKLKARDRGECSVRPALIALEITTPEETTMKSQTVRTRGIFTLEGGQCVSAAQ